MDVLACIFLLLFGSVVFSVFVIDAFRTWKRQDREELRRETIKNALCDISEYLQIVAEHYVLKEIK